MSSGLTGSCLGSPAKYTTRARFAAISRAACWADFDGVKGAGKRVRDGRQVGRQVRGKRDDVFHRDRRNRRVVRIGAGVRIVAVQQVLITEVLETFRAPPALPARQDRPEKNPIALFDSGW